MLDRRDCGGLFLARINPQRSLGRPTHYTATCYGRHAARTDRAGDPLKSDVRPATQRNGGLCDYFAVATMEASSAMSRWRSDVRRPPPRHHIDRTQVWKRPPLVGRRSREAAVPRWRSIPATAPSSELTRTWPARRRLVLQTTIDCPYRGRIGLWYWQTTPRGHRSPIGSAIARRLDAIAPFVADSSRREGPHQIACGPTCPPPQNPPPGGGPGGRVGAVIRRTRGTRDLRDCAKVSRRRSGAGSELGNWMRRRRRSMRLMEALRRPSSDSHVSRTGAGRKHQLPLLHARRRLHTRKE